MKITINCNDDQIIIESKKGAVKSETATFSDIKQPRLLSEILKTIFDSYTEVGHFDGAEIQLELIDEDRRYGIGEW